MKLQSFLTVFKTRKTDEDKLNELRKHVVTNYIPFEQKADMAKSIINAAYYREENGRRVFHVDSVARYMLTYMAMIDLFTDIERTKREGKMLEDFNTLNSLCIFDMLAGLIEPRELKEFQMLVEMTDDDTMANEYEPHEFVKSQVERFGTLIGTAITPILDTIDVNQIKDAIQKQMLPTN